MYITLSFITWFLLSMSLIIWYAFFTRKWELKIHGAEYLQIALVSFGFLFVGLLWPLVVLAILLYVFRALKQSSDKYIKEVQVNRENGIW